MTAIVGMISDQQLKVASRIPREADLASQLGVSRGSLREAVRILAYLGILDVRVGDGTYVTELNGANLLGGLTLIGQVANETTVLEIFEIRRILESSAAAIAATRITDEQLEHLEGLLGQLAVEDDRERFVHLDICFHDAIVEATGNVALRTLCSGLSGQTQRARLMRSQHVEGILDRSRSEHADIFRYIASGRPTLAAAAATSHVANVEHWLGQELGIALPSARRSRDA
ncbi:FadR/GntR family transcriptional regulator [Candidatus Poriferisocius sp.]|uniref:FadR/GntR family transcriptional regulator n=1 Tax=Candidatus Poriferisocius sp. TaxID=3101276 RepID=UPI003B015304